ncbi:MAG: PAS domain S-box protein [Bacteroidota bacterium]
MPGSLVIPEEGILDLVQDSVLIYQPTAGADTAPAFVCTYLNASAKRTLADVPGCQLGSTLHQSAAAAPVIHRAFYEAALEVQQAGVPLERHFSTDAQDVAFTTALLGDAIAITARLTPHDAHHYAEIYHHTPVMMHSIDRQGKLVQVSDYWLDVMGYTRDEVLGRPSVDFLTEPSREHARAVLKDFYATGRCTDVSYQFIRKDGSVIDILLSAIAIYDADHEIERSLAVLVDVSQRISAQQELAQSEARNRALIEALPDLIFVFDADGVYLDCFPPSEEALAFPRDLFIGKSVVEVLPEPLGKASLQAIQTTLRTGETQVMEYPLPNQEGDVQHFEARLVKQDSHTVIAISREITERVAARKQLEAYANDLELSNEALERFAYVSSHDLQEPLRTIHSFTDLFVQRYGDQIDERGQEYLGFVTDGTRRMRALIDDLLAYSRLRGVQLTVTDVDLNGVLDEVQHALHAAIDERKALITTDVLPTLRADAGQIELLLQNLISNALKFQQPGQQPVIHVAAQRDGGYWAISVQDNGIGIKPDYFEQIFEMFKRLHTREDYAGTGIGLAICLRIARRHGGTLRVASAPGEGSTFTFTIPA